MFGKRSKKPEPTSSGPFFMPIEDTFQIKGLGVVVTGTILDGAISVGDQVNIVGLREAPTSAVVRGLEAKHQQIPLAQAGDMVGIMLRDIDPGLVERGMVVAQPDYLAAHTGFTADFHVADSETPPQSSFYFSITYPFQFSGEATLTIYKKDFQCTLSRADGTGINWSGMMSSDPLDLSVRVNTPIALKTGWQFSLQVKADSSSNDLRTIGIGSITGLS